MFFAVRDTTAFVIRFFCEPPAPNSEGVGTAIATQPASRSAFLWSSRSSTSSKASNAS
jgi:hypothetical protein